MTRDATAKKLVVIECPDARVAVMSFLAVAGFVVSLLALTGVYYAIKGVQYTKEQVDLLKADSDAKKRWASKHAQAFGLVMKTNKWIIFNSAQTNGYPLVFSDIQFRPLVEAYIVQMDWSKNLISPRVLDADQFALPVVQEVIQKTIETVERFKSEHPEAAHNLGLA